MATRVATAAAATTTAHNIKSEVNTLEPIVPLHGTADLGTPLPPPEPLIVDDEIDRAMTAGAEQARPAKRGARWWPLAILFFGMVGPFALLVESAITAPFFAITPGDARPTQPRIKITKAQTYDSAGQILFVTVGVPRLSNLAERFARRNHTDDVVKARDILGDQSPQENRQQNIRLMGYSKDFAGYVALTRLGYDVPLSGGGSVVDSTCLEPGDAGACKTESPAAKVLRRQDVIIAIDGQPVHISSDISPLLAGRAVGSTIELTIKRLGEPAPVKVTVPLTAPSEEPTRAIIGFIPNDAPPDDLKFSFPVELGIDSGQVGGPSAGLAFTLAVLDKLTAGELTGGVKVAATGTMSPNGRVGDIGGLRQKTVAVQRAGAKLFLVPADEAQAAVDQAKGSDLKVVGVNTIDDALKAISELGGNASELLTPLPKRS